IQLFIAICTSLTIHNQVQNSEMELWMNRNQTVILLMSNETKQNSTHTARHPTVFREPFLIYYNEQGDYLLMIVGFKFSLISRKNFYHNTGNSYFMAA